MKYFISVLILSGFLSVTLAQADQCAWLDAKDQKHAVESAVWMLKNSKSKEFVSFCSNCEGEHAVISNVQKAESVSQGNPSIGDSTYSEYKTITVNDKNIDLAYIYVRTGNRVFTNLALLTGCPASVEVPLLYTAPGKSPSPVSWDDLMHAGRSPASKGAIHKKGKKAKH